MHVDGGHRQKPIDFQRGHFQNGRLVAILDFFCFQTLNLVWLWISIPNLSGTILMYMCRSLLIFSNVNFKMAARQPYWNFWFPDSNFSFALNINCKLKWHNTYIYIYIYIGPVWLDQNQIWILKSGFWNHEVVNKQNVESESGFTKTNAKSGSIFYPDVTIYQFYPNDFFQNVIVLFH